MGDEPPEALAVRREARPGGGVRAALRRFGCLGPAVRTKLWLSRHRAVPGSPTAGPVRDRAVSYALELWATAELRAGSIERSGRLFALAERGYRQVRSGLWRTDAELHRQLRTELQAALGDRYDQLLVEARNLDFDDAIAQLIRSQSTAH